MPAFTGGKPDHTHLSNIDDGCLACYAIALTDGSGAIQYTYNVGWAFSNLEGPALGFMNSYDKFTCNRTVGSDTRIGPTEHSYKSELKHHEVKWNEPEFSSTWHDQSVSQDVYLRSFKCTPCAVSDAVRNLGLFPTTWNGNHCHVEQERSCTKNDNPLKSHGMKEWYAV